MCLIRHVSTNQQEQFSDHGKQTDTVRALLVDACRMQNVDREIQSIASFSPLLVSVSLPQSSSSQKTMAETSPRHEPGATLVSNESSSELRFDDAWSLADKLRSGSYGVVYTTKHKFTQQECAVKVVDRTKLKKKDDDAMFREVGILKDLLDVDHIIKLVDFYVEPNTFYVVQVRFHH